MKKTYMKPAVTVLLLQHHTQLLQSSVQDIQTNIDDEDEEQEQGEEQKKYELIWGGSANWSSR